MRWMATSWFVIASLALPTVAAAHFRMLEPESRYGGDSGVIKRPPCGITGGTRSTRVYTFEPGATIHLEWDEYIAHPGHYRVAFDIDGDDAFVDPATPTEYFSNDAVLMDEIESGTRGMHTLDVTLPDVECDNCTLQIIQVMTDHGVYGDGDDIYYQCVDLVLRRTGTTEDAGTPADGGGIDGGTTSDGGVVADAGAGRLDAGGPAASTAACACTAAGGGARSAWPLGWAVGFVALWGLRRRQRRRFRGSGRVASQGGAPGCAPS